VYAIAVALFKAVCAEETSTVALLKNSIKPERFVPAVGAGAVAAGGEEDCPPELIEIVDGALSLLLVIAEVTASTTVVVTPPPCSKTVPLEAPAPTPWL